MANANFSLGQVNITDYLHVIMRKVSTPLVEAARQTFPPPQPTTRNISFVGLDATTYYADFRESADGIALGILLASYVYDVKSQQVVAEMRYYQVNGPRPIDPASEQDTIVDPYLDGKTIAAVYKEGFRPLAPPTETFKEYDLVAGGGIQLLNGAQFSDSEVLVIWISHVVTNSGGGTSGGFAGVKTITANTLLDSTYYNNRIRCHGAGARLVVTFPALASIPDETPFYFTTNKGSQLQTKFVTQSGEMFEFAGIDSEEITIGKGEYVQFIKSGSRIEVTKYHANLLMVGERFSGTWKDQLNAIPEDGRLLDGDDYPRPWRWINNLPVTHYIVDDAVTGGGYVHPAGKEGLFVIHSTLKKFRMPNAQNWSERGLLSFTTYGADAARGYDYPGGSQAEMVGPHDHELSNLKGNDSQGGDQGNTVYNGTDHGAVPFSPIIKTAVNKSGGVNAVENRVKNIGIIYMRRI